MSSPSKMFSCVDSAAILRSPVNRSSAKQNWSFAKSPRFSQGRTQYLIQQPSCDCFYNLPSTKAHRNTSFGIGKKTDLQVGKNPHQIAPPPNTYSIPTFVDVNKLHKKGFTPRYSREDVAPMSYIEIEPMKMPGPGCYDQHRYNDSPHWSCAQRVTSEYIVYPKTTQKIVPGPGAHEQVDNINPVGRYNISKRRSSKSKVFDPKRSERFRNSCKTFIHKDSEVPGPGNYTPKNDLSGEGLYVLSQNVSSGKRSMLMGRRTSFVDQEPRRSKTPGPGSYRVPSDFGHYDEINLLSKNASARNIVSKKTARTKESAIV